MPSSCCGGSNKSEPAKLATTAARNASEVPVEQLAAKSEKSECCNNKGKATGCGC